MDEKKPGLETLDWDKLIDLGLYMDQVLLYLQDALPQEAEDLALTPSMINNYVKLGLVTRPVHKKYFREQIAQLIILLFLRPVLSLGQIKQLAHSPAMKGGTEGLYTLFLEALKGAGQSLENKGSLSALDSAVLAALCRQQCVEALKNNKDKV